MQKGERCPFALFFISLPLSKGVFFSKRAFLWVIQGVFYRAFGFLLVKSKYQLKKNQSLTIRSGMGRKSLLRCNGMAPKDDERIRRLAD